MSLWPTTKEELTALLAGCSPGADPPDREVSPLESLRATDPEMAAIFDDVAVRAREKRVIDKINQTLNEILIEDLAKLSDPPSLDLSENTKAAYKTTLARFRAWCEEAGVSYFPAAPESVACFVIEQCGIDDVRAMPAMAKRHISAIRFRHVIAGIQSPTDSQLVTAALNFIKRKAKEEE